MRSSLGFAFLLVSALSACGKTSPAGGGDDVVTPDAPGITPPARGFQVVSPEVTIMPGQEVTYCYYFRTPNTENMVIKKWSSVMTPGSHHVIMFTTGNDTMPPGTINTQGCGGFSGSNIPSWTYAAQTPEAEVVLPTDDGNGKPLGQEIAANTPAYFQMHYLNLGDTPLKAHVTLNAEAYDVGVAYTKTAAYITYNNSISIPPHAMGTVASQTCTTPANAKFWMVSTHAHKQAVKTEVLDGAGTSTSSVFSSTDWEHPGAKQWSAMPFFTFGSNKLTYQCTYNNTGTNANNTVVSGPSADTNEMCMATGYYFVPGSTTTKPQICFCQGTQCFVQ